MNKFELNELNIELQESDSTITMSWTGKSRDRNPSARLTPFFDEFIKKLENKKVIVNLQKLESMNSSTINPIVYLIRNLESKGIETELHVNRDSEWQDVIFKAIEVLVMKFKHVKICRV